MGRYREEVKSNNKSKSFFINFEWNDEEYDFFWNFSEGVIVFFTYRPWHSFIKFHKKLLCLQWTRYYRAIPLLKEERKDDDDFLWEVSYKISIFHFSYQEMLIHRDRMESECKKYNKPRVIKTLPA